MNESNMETNEANLHIDKDIDNAIEIDETTAETISHNTEESATGDKESFVDKMKSRFKTAPKADLETEKIEALIEEKNELNDRFVRLFAEFDNFKKRTAKERIDLIYSASSDVIKQLLPINDDFERAVKTLEPTEDKRPFEGFLLIQSKLKTLLEANSVKEININKGDDYNPDFAEAITQIDAGVELQGKVVDIVTKGYQQGDKIVRFAKVVIGNTSE